MNVYQKLNEARKMFHQTKLQKTGHNKFAGYKYFELGDFLPHIQKIFDDLATKTEALKQLMISQLEESENQFQALMQNYFSR